MINEHWVLGKIFIDYASTDIGYKNGTAHTGDTCRKVELRISYIWSYVKCKQHLS